MWHPIFGDLSNPEEKERRRREQASELRVMMERLWQSSRVINPRRVARYVPPMRHGSLWGYEDEIYAE